MSRQQASPVVRPLPVFTSADAARAFVLSKPLIDGQFHIANFILKSYRVEAGGVEIMPLMQVMYDDSTVSGYLEACDDDVKQTHVVNGTDITTQVTFDEMPCTEGTVIVNDTLSYLREFINEMAADDYEVDEIIVEKRKLNTSERVDAIIDF